jgi:hypothetical protein
MLMKIKGEAGVGSEANAPMAAEKSADAAVLDDGAFASNWNRSYAAGGENRPIKPFF